MTGYKSASGSAAEDLFIELFADTFGAEKRDFYIRNIIFSIYIITIVLRIFFLKAVQEK